MKENLTKPGISFIKDGGEMGFLIREYNWSNTILGNPEKWPQSLRTALSILINSKFPMFLWWGPELICFYNDAYRPSLGMNGKHPSILGQPAAVAWTEIWHIIKPLIDQVMGGGEATWSEDQLIPIYRNGKIEDVYWTFSYSPVFDESGKPGGILVTCMETTEKVHLVSRFRSSEKRIRSVVEAATVATSVFTGSQMILEMANDLAFQYWGKDSSIIGKPLLEFLPELKGQVFPELLDHVFKTGETHAEQEAKVLRKRGDHLETFYVDFSYRALKNELGETEALLIMAMDVTDRFLTRKKLEESKDQLAFAIEAAELGTFDYNPITGNFSANSRLREWFGLDPDEEITLRHVIDSIAETDKTSVISAMEKALEFKSNYLFDIQYTVVHPVSKKEMVVHAKGKSFFNEDQVTYRFTGTLQDITEQKSFEHALENQVSERTSQLNEKNTELQKMNAELHSFAYVSSHDLQEPLRKILTFSDLIAQRDELNLSAEGKHHFSRIQASAQRMRKLIEDLLTYSQTSSSAYIFELVDLDILLGEVTEELNDTIIKKQATVINNGLGKLKIIRFQFLQLFQNLLSNSLKFSSNNRNPKIEISSRITIGYPFRDQILNPAIKYYHLEFKDNGIGFEPQYEENIFKIFQRLHGHTEYSGTGIGLAIVKKIVENHQGLINAKAALDKGAIFNIYLPVTEQVFQKEN